jgi:hypothetical protein
VGNILSYLKWRGDLSFDVCAFNEVDNLVLSTLAYVNFSGVVPDCGISVREAYDLLIERGLYQTLTLTPFSVDLLAEAAKSTRFRGAKLSHYVDKVNEEQHMQFAALHFCLDDETTYIAFRGTDATLTGWREDFTMGFCVVPAQTEALAYLQNTMKPGAAYRVGGHSKGGNLAVYASMMARADLQSQIIAVYNNDGPGFGKSVIARDDYVNIRSKIRTIVPQSSTVGMLLEHEEEYKVVKSDGLGPFQHDGFSWEVLGTGFIQVDSITSVSVNFDRTIKDWLHVVSPDKREAFVDTLFAILESTGAKTLTDLGVGRIKKINSMINTYAQLDKETRDMLTDVVLLLLKESAKPTPRNLRP